MIGLVTIGLIVAVILLWRRVGALERRLEGVTVPPAARVKDSSEPRRPPAVVVQRAVAADDATIEAPAPPPEEIAPAPEPAPLPKPPRPPRRSINFEELFGSRLPIWGGGITLAVAGLFIVKYSIDSGLLSPAVRAVLGLLFAVALVVVAEVARRWKTTAIDPRVAQALAGAGIAAAYADILMATNVYHLIPQSLGFVGLALTTAAALGLALRFGSPTALLGLVGGLAAPALVGEQTASIAPLTLYLALVIGGLSAVARRQRWPWLSVAALVGGFGWGLVLILFDRINGTNGLALGGYALLLAFAIPMLASGLGHDRLLRAGAAIAGTLQLALIVSMGGYSLFHWGLYGLLSIAVLVLARIDRKQALLPLLALGTGLVTLLGWRTPPPAELAIVSGSAMLLFGAPALFDLWQRRGNWRDALQLVFALGGTLGAASLVAPHALSDTNWGIAALLLSLPVLLIASWSTREPSERRDAGFPILTAAATLMIVAGLIAILPELLPATVFAALLVALGELARRRRDLDYRWAMLVAGGATLIAIMPSFGAWLAGTISTLDLHPLLASELPRPIEAMLELLLPAGLIGVAVWRSSAPLVMRHRGLLTLIPALIATAGAFIFYKQIFRIDGASAFVSRGFAERVLFNQLLFVAGWLAWQQVARWPALRTLAIAATGVGLARVLLYDALLFNPLWRDQLVGTIPLANLLTPAFLLPIGWLWLATRAEPLRVQRLWPAIGLLQMLLILLFAGTSIRHLFHGSLIAVGDVGPSESFAYSLGAVVIAIGFLRWGIARRDRIWRIASLVLMLVAVGKVFLSDAAGLDGLLRIASFVGLGFSLIGIGWLYSRHLGVDRTVEA